ncbi:hypothetical protein G7046_g530 [Stylonectria norvegica]|nr:hypothetical protein G7046_g530 [Stylonectria norvegica]
MTTRDIASQHNFPENNDTGVGPVTDIAEAVAQSLLDKQYKIGSKANKPTDKPFDETVHQDTDEMPPTKNRVMSTGARTPCSLALEILSQTAQKAADNSFGEKSPDKDRKDPNNAG